MLSLESGITWKPQGREQVTGLVVPSVDIWTPGNQGDQVVGPRSAVSWAISLHQSSLVIIPLWLGSHQARLWPSFISDKGHAQHIWKQLLSWNVCALKGSQSFIHYSEPRQNFSDTGCVATPRPCVSSSGCRGGECHLLTLQGWASSQAGLEAGPRGHPCVGPGSLRISGGAAWSRVGPAWVTSGGPGAPTAVRGGPGPVAAVAPRPAGSKPAPYTVPAGPRPGPPGL